MDAGLEESTSSEAKAAPRKEDAKDQSDEQVWELRRTTSGKPIPLVPKWLAEKYGTLKHEPFLEIVVRGEGLDLEDLKLALPSEVSLEDLKAELERLSLKPSSLIELAVPERRIEYYDAHCDAELKPVTTTDDLRTVCRSWDESYPERRKEKIESYTSNALRIAASSHASEKLAGALLLAELATDQNNFRLVQDPRSMFEDSMVLIVPPFSSVSTNGESTDITYLCDKSVLAASIGGYFFWKVAEHEGIPVAEANLELSLDRLFQTLEFMLANLFQRRAQALQYHRQQVYDTARSSFDAAEKTLRSAKTKPGEAPLQIPRTPATLDDFLTMQISNDASDALLVFEEIKEAAVIALDGFQPPGLCDMATTGPGQTYELDENKIALLQCSIGACQAIFPRLVSARATETFGGQGGLMLRLASSILDAVEQTQGEDKNRLMDALMMATKLVYNILREAPDVAWAVAECLPILGRLIMQDRKAAGAGIIFMILRTDRGQRASSASNLTVLIGNIIPVADQLINSVSERVSAEELGVAAHASEMKGGASTAQEDIFVAECLVVSLWGAVSGLQKHNFVLSGLRRHPTWFALINRILAADTTWLNSKWIRAAAVGILALVGNERMMSSVLMASTTSNAVSLTRRIFDLVCDSSSSILSRDNAARALTSLTRPFLYHAVRGGHDAPFPSSLINNPSDEGGMLLSDDAVIELMENVRNDEVLPRPIFRALIQTFHVALGCDGLIQTLLSCMANHHDTLACLAKKRTFEARTRLSLERAVVRTIMNLLCVDVEGEIQQTTLEGLVSLLKSRDQTILEEGSLCLWLAAHNRQNRKLLGSLGAIDALVAIITTPMYPKLRTKALDNAISALWLLACDSTGADLLIRAKTPREDSTLVISFLVRMVDKYCDDQDSVSLPEDATTRVEKACVGDARPVSERRGLIAKAAVQQMHDIEDERSLSVVADSIEKQIQATGSTETWEGPTAASGNDRHRATVISTKEGDAALRDKSQIRTRTLLLGLLGHLSRTSDIGRGVVMQQPLARSVFTLLSRVDEDEHLQLVALQLAALIVEMPESISKRHKKVLADLGNLHGSTIEHVLTPHLKQPRLLMKCAVARFFAMRSIVPASRTAMAESGATRILTALATRRRGDEISTQYWALNALLNASSTVENQDIIAKEGLDSLVRMACGWSDPLDSRKDLPKPNENVSKKECPAVFDFTPQYPDENSDVYERLAVSILSNLETNVRCRTKLFELQIKMGCKHFRSAMAPSLGVSSVFAEDEEMRNRERMARGSTQMLLSSGVRSMWDSEKRKDSTLRFDHGSFGAPFGTSKRGQWAEISALTSRPSSKILPRKGTQRVGVISAESKSSENPWDPNIARIETAANEETELKPHLKVTLAQRKRFNFKGGTPKVPEPLPDDYHQTPADVHLVRKIQQRRTRLFKWKHSQGYPSGTAKVHDRVFGTVQAAKQEENVEENYFWLQCAVPVVPENFGEFPVILEPDSFQMIRLDDVEALDPRSLEECGKRDLFETILTGGRLPSSSAGDLPLMSGSMELYYFGGRVRFGLRPDPVTLLAHSEEPPEPEIIKSPAPTEKKIWDAASRSVFAPRIRRSDSRALYQTPIVVQRALKRDFSKLLDEDRFWKFCMTHDDANCKRDIESEVQELLKTIAPFYELLLGAFNYYGGILGSDSTALCYMIGEADFMRFAYEAKLIDESEPEGDEYVSEVFVLVNVHVSDAATKKHKRALTRSEFLEALCRIAVWKCRNVGMIDLSEMVEHVLQNHMPNVINEARYTSTFFRKERVLIESTDLAIRSHLPLLRALFKRYTDHSNGISLASFIKMMDHSKLTRSTFWNISERDCRMAYFFAKDIVVDDVRARNRTIVHTFEDFIEALLFIAEYFPLPSDVDLAAQGLFNKTKPVDQFMVLFDFKMHYVDDIAERVSLPPRLPYGPMSVAQLDTARPMAQKFDYFIRLFAGKLSLKYRGRMDSFSFLSTGYSSEEMLQMDTVKDGK